jgi:hypothetical protein
MADTEIRGETWFEQATPIADEVYATGEIPPPAEAVVDPYDPDLELHKRFDAIEEDLAYIMGVLAEVAPMMELAKKYLSGTKMDKARMALGLRSV